MKKFKLFTIILTLALALALCVACTPEEPSTTPSTTPSAGNATFYIKGASGAFDVALADTYTVEYGDSFTVPEARLADGTVATVSAKDVNGNNAAIQFGQLRTTSVGNYSLTYVAGEATKSVTVVCSDTVAPVITVQTHTLTSAEGDTMLMPYYTANDRADIDYARSHTVITAPDGTVASEVDGVVELNQAGTWTFTINCYDKNGVLATKVLTTRVARKFVDTSTGANVLYDFDQEDYLELTFDVEGKKSAEREIVTSGYPAIEGESDGNGVLALYDSASTSSTMQDLYVKLRLHTNFVPGDNQVGSIKIRFAVSTRTDYVKLLRGGFICHRYNTLGGIEPNVWHELVLDPMQWGYYREFDGLTLYFRDKGQTTLYIDEITWMPSEWNDTLSENVLGDFDEAGYMHKVFQNIYNDPTTTTSYCVDGTTFTHMTEGYPGANSSDKANFPGLGASGGVMKFKTTYLYGGITYMFPRIVDLDEINKITIRFYSVSPQPLSWVFGFFDGNTEHLGHTVFADSTDTEGSGKANAKSFDGDQWCEVSFTADELALWTTDGTVTGIFIQMWPQKYYSPDHDYDVCEMYLDEIFVE